MLDICYNYECQYDFVFNDTKLQFICFCSEWDKETAELLLGTGMLQRVKELKWIGIYFDAGKRIKIVMQENRRKYGCFTEIMQKESFVNRECLVNILYILHCLFLKFMFGICCTFGVKSILNPLNE